MKFIVVPLFIGVLFPAVVFGHGWGAYDQGAKARGMAAAFTGLADDPTAIAYNPAGIVQLHGTQGSLGFIVANIHGTYESRGTSGMTGITAGTEQDLETSTVFIPNLYITHEFNDNLTLGFGEYTVFGNPFEWDDSFEGRFAPSGRLGQFYSIELCPVAAYKVTDSLSLGLGGRVEYAKMDLKNMIYLGPDTPEVEAELSGDDYALGWNMALLYKILDDLRLGLSYRSKTKHTMDDIDVKFTPQIPLIPVPGDGTLRGLANTKASTDITLPQYVSLGLAWKQGPLTMTVDGFWWDWSEIDELRFELDQDVAGSSSIVSPMDWDDTWTWAIGAEYKVKALGRDISLRGGFMYEQCPTPANTVSPAGFQGDNLLYNIGLGSPIGPVYADFFLSYVYTKDRSWDNAAGTAPNPGGGPVTGEFNGYRTYMIGNNITYKF